MFTVDLASYVRDFIEGLTVVLTILLIVKTCLHIVFLYLGTDEKLNNIKEKPATPQENQDDTDGNTIPLPDDPPVYQAEDYNETVEIWIKVIIHPRPGQSIRDIPAGNQSPGRPNTPR